MASSGSVLLNKVKREEYLEVSSIALGTCLALIVMIIILDQNGVF